MTSITKKLSEIVGEAFVERGLPADLGTVRVSDRPDLAQFQCNGAMPAAKFVKKAPRAVAEEVVKHLEEEMDDIFEKIEIAGPGFINLTVYDTILADLLCEVYEEEDLDIEQIGEGKTVMLDYGGPNVAKAMHVGHLRTSIIGEALKRANRALGYNTIGDIHLGDWGTQMGMVISELEVRHPEWPYFDPSITSAYPETSPVTIDDLETLYPEASKACKADEDRMAKARQATVQLQEGRAGYRALWQHMVDVSIQSIKTNYEALNISFDLWNGEASVHDLIAPMTEKLKAGGWAKESDGAIVIPVAKDDDKKEFPPLILYKSDGAVMYGTTDLATLVERERDHNPDRIIYVVDQRQKLHFEQVFRAAKLTKITPEKTDLEFLGYGTMNGTDGKPFKTRDGGVMRLEDLIEMGREKALARLNEANLASDMSAEERTDIATIIGVAAVKFADLQNAPISDYVFDLDRMTSFEGKTGPYMLYQAVRIKSLLVKAADRGYTPAPEQMDFNDADRPLALLLAQFQDVLELMVKNNAPNTLADHLFRLAQEFSSFYANCHILSEEEDNIRDTRLALCSITLKQLEKGLDILGIETPDRM